MITQIDFGRLKAADFVLVVFELFDNSDKFHVRGDNSSRDRVTDGGLTCSKLVLVSYRQDYDTATNQSR